jgi:methylglyoxal synthase
MVALATEFAPLLRQHSLMATGTTGRAASSARLA